MAERLVLIFHGIGEPHVWADAAERRVWCATEEFISIVDALPEVSERRQMAIDITFDDGNVSDYEIALPALRARGLKATFFVCAGRLGQAGYLEADHLRGLVDAGMTVGSHGWDHVDWRDLPDRAVADRELVLAKDVLEDALRGRPIDAVALPFGSYDRHVLKAVSGLFDLVYSCDGGLAESTTGLIARECFSTSWTAASLWNLASRRSLRENIRRALAIGYKVNRFGRRSGWSLGSY